MFKEAHFVFRPRCIPMLSCLPRCFRSPSPAVLAHQERDRQRDRQRDQERAELAESYAHDRRVGDIMRKYTPLPPPSLPLFWRLNDPAPSPAALPPLSRDNEASWAVWAKALKRRTMDRRPRSRWKKTVWT